jgi:hypothetical protein
LFIHYPFLLIHRISRQRAVFVFCHPERKREKRQGHRFPTHEKLYTRRCRASSFSLKIQYFINIRRRTQ